MDIVQIETPRLFLREWSPKDQAAFARLNADPEVMRHFPKPLSQTESDELFANIQKHFDEHGYGVWAVQLRSAPDSACIGFTGLNRTTFEAPFTPAVEIAWRLARESQGQGYATEAAQAVLDFAFDRLRLPEIISFTVIENRASRRVMEKIGLIHTPALDFEHPGLPPGHPLRPHVFYRIANPRPQ